jgi:hypothetical protein
MKQQGKEKYNNMPERNHSKMKFEIRQAKVGL